MTARDPVPLNLLQTAIILRAALSDRFPAERWGCVG